MSRVLKRAWNIASTILVIVIAVFALALGGARLTGIRSYAVLSGSMEPACPVGSLIFVKQIPISKLRSGDVITFMQSADIVVTHRITEVINDKESEAVSFRTKGDANDTEDAGRVDGRNIIGTPIVRIRKLGYVLSYIQQPSGKYLLIAVCAAIILLNLLSRLFTSKGNKS